MFDSSQLIFMFFFSFRFSSRRYIVVIYPKYWCGHVRTAHFTPLTLNRLSPRRPGYPPGYCGIVSVVPGITCAVVPVVLGSACLVPVILGVTSSSRVLVVPVDAPSPGGVPSYTAMVFGCILMKRDDDELEGVRERIGGGVFTVLISML